MRTRTLATLGAAALFTGLVGCGGDDDGGGVNTTDGPIDSLPDEPIVDDAEIRYTDGAGVLSLGGLEIAWPVLGELDYYLEEGRNITVPPAWPTIAAAQLASNADPIGNPTIGPAVLAQTTLVTDDESRAQLVDDSLTVSTLDDPELIHDSTTTGGDVTCWAQVHSGRSRAGSPPQYRAVVFFAGSDIASSGIVVWGPSTFDRIPAMVGDLVESVCGSRPDGL